MEALNLHSLAQDWLIRMAQHPSELQYSHKEEVQLLQLHHLWNALEASVTGCGKQGLTLQISFHQGRLRCRCHMAVNCRVSLIAVNESSWGSFSEVILHVFLICFLYNLGVVG